MDNIMTLKPGKYTLETFAKHRGLKRQSALNLLSKLKKQGLLQVAGGGRQKRIYTISDTPGEPTNGFYDIVNKYSPEKLIPKFRHHVVGRYTIEHAIVDGIQIGDIRTLEATMHLFRHISSWKRLFDLARKRGVEKELHALYTAARKRVKCKAVPRRYQP